MMKKILDVVLSLVLLTTRGINFRRQMMMLLTSAGLMLVASIFVVVGIALLGRGLFLSIASVYGDIVASSTVGVVSLLVSVVFVLLVQRCWR